MDQNLEIYLVIAFGLILSIFISYLLFILFIRILKEYQDDKKRFYKTQQEIFKKIQEITGRS